ncbi:MAG: 50S ribosomal protein L3 [Actinobacteria bacterium]|nr:50S ribosomal protein L3 [Actinomycetota bacterium]MCL6104668.1 50S ribosomal protein L3 [Actinomycetota bacterium]
MTQIWDSSNKAVPVTVLRVVPVRIVQIKTPQKEGYSALQVTYGFKKSTAFSAPERGHFSSAGVQPGKHLVELRVDDVDGYEVGQEITVSVLKEGKKVDVTASTKGRGFTGAMKRHNFSGQGASHGNHKKHRSPGSIGACATPARVFKGMKMPGRMGATQVTILNLEVVQTDLESEIVLLKGSIPGPRGGMVVIRQSAGGVG